MEVGEKITVIVYDDGGEDPNLVRPINEPEYSGKEARVFGGRSGRVYLATTDSEYPKYFQLRILERRAESSLNSEEHREQIARHSFNGEDDYEREWEVQQQKTRSKFPDGMR